MRAHASPDSTPNGTGSNTALEAYLREINKIPLLTPAEEREVAKRAKSGERDAQNELVQANLRFVVTVAKQYANLGVPIEDLINDGNIGLMRAAERFDVDRGFKFITYAVWWIRQAMLQSLAENSRIVRLPMNRASLLYKINRAVRDMVQELGREPTSSEIAEALDVPEHQVRDTLVATSTYVSLDEPMSGERDDGTIGDYITDKSDDSTDTQAMHVTLGNDLRRALSTLSEREQCILTDYFGLDGRAPLTLEAIGKKLGLTRERIRQIKEKALQRLRHQSRAQLLEGHHGTS